MTFQQWISGLIERRFRTATAIAEAIGMRVSPFTRGVATGTLNVVNLLKLARVAEEHPSEVLRLAGKGDVAELIESLYGQTDATVTLAERQHLQQWRQLSPRARGSIDIIMRDILERQHPTAKPDKTRRSA